MVFIPGAQLLDALPVRADVATDAQPRFQWAQPRPLQALRFHAQGRLSQRHGLPILPPLPSRREAATKASDALNAEAYGTSWIACLNELKYIVHGLIQILADNGFAADGVKKAPRVHILQMNSLDALLQR